MLNIRNLSKQFGSKKVLDDVSVKIPQGGIALFLGASGVGKSTLLRILADLEKADSGSITLDGNKLSDNHQVGMVFQQFNLFDHLTAERNITLALEQVVGMDTQKAQKVADDLLSQYGLADKKNIYPPALSGGQKQRLALARTVALKPRVICFDEPTSALDPMLTNHVAQAIQDLAQNGYIVAIATHDTALLDALDCTVYLMKDGTIIESVSSQKLKNNPSEFQQIKKFIAGTDHE